MMLIRSYVAQSAIDGVGLFAAEPVAKGALVWRLDPAFDRVIPRTFLDEAPDCLKDYLYRYAYPHRDDPALLVLEVDNSRFMNHAADANTDFSEWGEGRALRDIAAGEELTCDYAGFYEDFELMPPAPVS